MLNIEDNNVISTAVTLLFIFNLMVIMASNIALIALYVKNQFVFACLVIPLFTFTAIFSVCGERIIDFLSLKLHTDNTQSNNNNDVEHNNCNYNPEFNTNNIPTPSYTELANFNIEVENVTNN